MVLSVTSTLHLPKYLLLCLRIIEDCLYDQSQRFRCLWIRHCLLLQLANCAVVTHPRHAASQLFVYREPVQKSLLVHV